MTVIDGYKQSLSEYFIGASGWTEEDFEFLTQEIAQNMQLIKKLEDLQERA